MDRITVVGIGPGSDGFLVPAAKDAIAGAEILAGAPRHLVPFNGSGKILLPMEGELDSFLDVLAEKRHCGKTVLLLSGDPCLFSLLGKITARFSPDEYEVIPGVSSFQLLFAKLGIQWNGTEIASLHGRPLEDACRFIRGTAGHCSSSTRRIPARKWPNTFAAQDFPTGKPFSRRGWATMTSGSSGHRSRTSAVDLLQRDSPCFFLRRGLFLRPHSECSRTNGSTGLREFPSQRQHAGPWQYHCSIPWTARLFLRSGQDREE